MTYALNNIPVDLIEDNERNFYSIDGIAALAEGIRTVGLLHPIRVVRLPSGHYRCVDGHRRLSAYRLLSEEDEGFGTIPAYELPVMESLEEQTMLLMANANNRQMTPADLHRQEAELRQLLEARRAAGKPVPKNLSQYMAGVLGVSRNEVSRMHTTNSQLIPEGKQLLEEGKLNASAAYAMARKPEDEQREALKAQLNEDLQQQAAANAQAETARVQSLVRLAGKFAGKYMPELLKGRLSRAVYRRDVVDAFKELAHRNYGRTCDGLRYGLTSTHVDIADGTASVNASITEFADAVLVATLRAYAARQLRSGEQEAKAPASKMDTPWRTGHPESPCWCVCRIADKSMDHGVYSRLWWGGKKWNFSSGSHPDDQTSAALIECVTHWIPVPEEELG